MEIASSATHKRIHIISGIFILLGLYLTSLYSYQIDEHKAKAMIGTKF